MSVACQCDRCGKMYPYIYNSKDPNAFVCAHINANRTLEKSGEVYDLCPSCFNELTKWLENNKEYEG